MSISLFLLYTAFIAKTSAVLLNSSIYEISPSKNVPVITFSKNLTGVSNDDINDKLRLQIINTKREIFEECDEFSEELRRLDKEQLDNATATGNYLIDELTKIYKVENNSAAEYYKEKRNAEECFAPIEWLNHQINFLFVNAISCFQKKFSYFVYYRSRPKFITEDAARRLDRLSSTASMCMDDECVENIKTLINELLEIKLEDLDTAYETLRRHVTNKMIKYNDCLRFNEVVDKYERDLKKDFLSLRKCVDLKSRQRLNPRDRYFL